MTTTLPGAAPPWTDQPARPPVVTSGQILTAAARARLRASGLADSDAVAITSTNGVVRLRDVEEYLVSKDRGRPTGTAPDDQQTCSLVGPTAAPTGTWLSTQTPIGRSLPAQRAAAALVAAARVMRRDERLVSGSVESFRLQPGRSWHTVSFDDVTGFDGEAIARLITATESRDAISPVDIRLVDATDSTAARLLPAPGRNLLISLGHPQLQVVASSTREGDVAIAVSEVVEVWLHTGTLDTSLGPLLLEAVTTAIRTAGR